MTTTIRQHPIEGLLRYGVLAACVTGLGVGLVPFGEAVDYGLEGFDAPAEQTTSGLLTMPFRGVR